MATVLRVDHNADVVTTYFRDARSHRVFNTPAVQPHTVIHCADAQAVFASVRQHLNHYDVDLVLAAGHGLHDRFEGHDGNPHLVVHPQPRRPRRNGGAPARL
jgi:hypothetical protein